MHFLDLGEGEPIVFIHGFSSNKESWTCQFDLSQTYRLIIPDLRGHGESEVYDGISLKQFAKDVLGILNNLKIEKAHFCGLSMGGIVVQEIYKQQPHRVKSIILSNTFSKMSASLNFLFTFAFKLKLKKLLKLPHEEQLAATAKAILYSLENEDVVNKTKYALTFKKKGFEITANELFKGFNYYDVLSSMQVPMLIIGSKNDSIAPIRFTKRFYKKANKAFSELFIFEEAGHMPNIEQQDKYNRLLLDFLQHVG
ncbi:alpha/beta hydrolase [Neobacillus cucumis]|uniref:alpha/beta fold hydrolase n=1 Tax=Neobacillus cucumis TaxID=1740721 RepID=UPI0018DF71D3|nr:alpha/beta hydrolase [Neobacillus cucumis]MBI0580038.1 alpha/beta hydrolase [Neobacillus cucumis]